ncbi:MAG: HAD family phosphatase [Candidatus Poseidoniia archaeon]|nr:HAD family phosphatase [Candidatus Poseidoniia archaeon]HIH78761.1 HAD-IB family phosphatase [Candidatus Poseidoniia archaeon]
MALKLVVFDMDGTLIRPKSSWQILHDHFGTDNREMLARYLQHEVSDAEFVAKDLELWTVANGGPIDAATVNRALDGAEPLPGAAEAVEGLHAAGITTAIISGGIDYLAQKLATEWGMAEAHANPLFDTQQGLQGEILVSGHAKAPVMREVVARHGVSRDEVAAVGDTVVDLDLFSLAGTSVAVNTSNERVVDAATHHLPDESLDGLLELLLPDK